MVESKPASHRAFGFTVAQAFVHGTCFGWSLLRPPLHVERGGRASEMHRQVACARRLFERRSEDGPYVRANALAPAPRPSKFVPFRPTLKRQHPLQLSYSLMNLREEPGVRKRPRPRNTRSAPGCSRTACLVPDWLASNRKPAYVLIVRLARLGPPEPRRPTD